MESRELQKKNILNFQEKQLADIATIGQTQYHEYHYE